MTTISPLACGTDDRAKLREVIQGCRLVALTTAGRDGLLRSRPLVLLEMDDASRLWFFVSAGSEWVSQLEPAVPANVTLSDELGVYGDSGPGWVSISGRATLVSDPVTVERLWTPAAEAFFVGPSDPDIRLLCLAADSVDYWDARGVGRYLEMVKSMGDAES